MIRFGHIRPLMALWFLVALTLGMAGDSFGQRRGYGGGGGYSAPVYRPTPPRPMTPAPRPMVPANSNMAPRPMTSSIGAPRMPAPANSNVRGPSGGPGMSSQAGRTLPTKLATAPVAQVPSYTGRVTVKGAPIVVTKAGATYSIPEKGVFSTKTVQRFQFVRNTLVRHSADGKIAILQTRITKYASAPQLVTTRIAASTASPKAEAKTSTQTRNSPGSATSGPSNVAVDGKWLRGTSGNVGLFPKQIADKLAGKSFKSFDDFRQTFWKTVSETPELSAQFSERNQSLMKKGLAPIAPESQHLGKQKSYVLHHKTPINQGGGVYDMDNIVVVTPLYHKDTLEKGYHYGN